MSIIKKKNFGFEIPKPFYRNKGDVKCIVLGCDPSSNLAYEKNIGFDTVFGLSNTDYNNFNKTRDDNKIMYKYFGMIKSNLLKIFKDEETMLNSIYVQNLCRNYLEQETSKYNIKKWKNFIISEGYIELLKDEIKQFPKVPILLTSYYLLYALDDDCKAVKYYYDNLKIVENKELDRDLIMFSRCPAYSLKNYSDYCDEIKNCLKV